MAKMYGQLPSYVKEHATLYDMRVTSAVLAWEQEQYDKASGKPSTPKLSQEDMKAMLKRVRKEK
jgi:hypothetical protein